MRLASVLFSALVLAGCHGDPTSGGRSSTTPAPSDASVEFLLTSAAADFHAHPPRPVRFRGVRSGSLVTADGAKQYRLCGEFQADGGAGGATWTRFATIKTSGYEQWTGGQASPFCEDGGIAWDAGDLSASLQSRLDALH